MSTLTQSSPPVRTTNLVCERCKRVDDSDGLWWAWSHAFGLTLCYGCYGLLYEEARQG